MKPITPVKLSLSAFAANNWTDYNLSSIVSENAVGVMLEIVNNQMFERNWSIRKNGSTDNLYNTIEDTGHTWVGIGLDDNKILEYKVANTSNVEIWVHAEFDSSEAEFFTNNQLLAPYDYATYTDIDISPYTSTPAKVAFLLVDMGSTTSVIGVRPNGSSEFLYASMFAYDLRGFCINVDENEIFEIFAEASSAYVDTYLTGYLHDNFTGFINRINYGASSSSWETVDFSPDIPAGNTGAFFHFTATGEYRAAIRKKGTSINNFYDVTNQMHGWVEIDSNRQAEQYVEVTFMPLYLWGYTSEAVGEPPVTAGQFTFVGIV